MASAVDGSKIFIPFMPSLLHMALVKEAQLMFKAFGTEMLDIVFENIQAEYTSTSNEDSQQNKEETFIRAKKYFLLIPVLLRKRVMEAVKAVHYGNICWRDEHSNLGKELDDGKYILYWRSDGTMDRDKTAQQLVLKESINIRKRFKIACMYCLEKSIQTLWFEMRRITGKYKRADNLIFNFWINRMRDGSRVHWTQALLEYLSSHDFSTALFIRYSSFFPLLQSEDRQNVLNCLVLTGANDLRFCLYAMTKKEEEQMIKMNAYNILFLHLQWPLQDMFLEIADKMWNHVDIKCFRNILKAIIDRIDNYEDFDYREILEGFLNTSPNHLRETVKTWKRFRATIDSYLNGSRKKKEKLIMMNERHRRRLLSTLLKQVALNFWKKRT